MQNDTTTNLGETDGCRARWFNPAAASAAASSAAASSAAASSAVASVTAHWLVGIWRLFRADDSLDFAPGVRMEFTDDGSLRYHIDVGGADQVVELLYRVEGDTLHTENVVTPHSMTVHFAREGEDVLALDFGGASAWLLREYLEEDK